MSRVNSKDKYILHLLTIFRRKGLNLTMDEIAKGIKITKKTLYNNFSSKEDLLLEVMNHVINELENQIDSASRRGENAIEALCLTSKALSSGLERIGPQLISDSVKYLPQLTILDLKGGINFNSRIIMDNLNRGIEENLYRSDINKELITIFFTAAMSQLYLWEGTYIHLKDAYNFHRELIRYHLEAIVNDNGRELLETYIKKSYICDSKFK